MPSTMTRPRKHRRTRRLYGEQRPQESQVPIYMVGTVKTGPTLTITFDQPVMLGGKPNFTTDLAGVSVVSAEQTGPNTVQLVYSDLIAGATEINLPFRDPAIRNASGGYVTSSKVAL